MRRDQCAICAKDEGHLSECRLRHDGERYRLTMSPGQTAEATERRGHANLGDVAGLGAGGRTVQAWAPAPRHGHQSKAHVRHAVLKMAEASGQRVEDIDDEGIDGVNVIGQEVGQVMDGAPVPVQ